MPGRCGAHDRVSGQHALAHEPLHERLHVLVVRKRHAEPPSQKDLLVASGRTVSASRRLLAGMWGMNVPRANLIQSISAPAVQDATPAPVNGPTASARASPSCLMTTMCQRLSAGRTVDPSLSVRPCVTAST